MTSLFSKREFGARYFIYFFNISLNFWHNGGEVVLVVIEVHTRTRLFDELQGRARAPDMSKGKGNHCKSHSVTCASFWGGKQFFVCPLSFPPHFGSVLTLLRTHPSSIASPEVFFFFILPSTDIHSSPLAFRLNCFCICLFCFYIWNIRNSCSGLCAPGAEIWRWRQIPRLSAGFGLE